MYKLENDKQHRPEHSPWSLIYNRQHSQHTYGNSWSFNLSTASCSVSKNADPTLTPTLISFSYNTEVICGIDAKSCQFSGQCCHNTPPTHNRHLKLVLTWLIFTNNISCGGCVCVFCTCSYAFAGRQRELLHSPLFQVEKCCSTK